MARRIVHQLVDDLDGTVLEVGDGETVLFSLDGAAYEIDLTTDNANELRTALQRFVDAARPVSTRRSAASPRKRSAASTYDLAAVRTWARAQGHTVSDRGRVPGGILEAYTAANGS